MIIRSCFLYQSLFANWLADRSVVQVEKVCNVSLTISVTMHRLDNPWVRGPHLRRRCLLARCRARLHGTTRRQILL